MPPSPGLKPSQVRTVSATATKAAPGSGRVRAHSSINGGMGANEILLGSCNLYEGRGDAGPGEGNIAFGIGMAGAGAADLH